MSDIMTEDDFTKDISLLKKLSIRVFDCEFILVGIEMLGKKPCAVSD